MHLILTVWIAFLVASFLVSILALTYVQSRAFARYGLRNSMERAQRAPLDMYWRELSPLERGLVWPGLIAFGITLLAALVWGVVVPSAR
jgi:hypothetical protein